MSSSSGTNDWRGRWGCATLLAVVVACGGARAASDCHQAANPITLSSRKASKLLLAQAKPEYPPAAQVNYIRGKVKLAVTVGCEGRVEMVHVLDGHPFLAQAAMDAVRRWVYRPYHNGSGAAPFRTRVDVNFDLRNPNLNHFPARADEDLLREVQPPRLLSALSDRVTGDTPRLRILVSSEGRVIDSTLVRGTVEEFREAAGVVTHWRFAPARCDNLDVPWYVEMAVPVPAATK